MWLFNKRTKKIEFEKTPKFHIVARTDPTRQKKQEKTKSWILGESKSIDITDIDMCIEDDN